MTQQELVESHLKSGQSITPLDALTLYKSLRLSSIVQRLRKKGLDIKTEFIGEKRYARYFIPKGEAK